MASLNLSINGPSIKSSYQGVVNGALPPSGSPTYGRWALFSVQAPLVNAFQDSGNKESVLKVETTGDGELADLIEDLSEGRVQYAFVKVKDPNSNLPKNVFIAWCGGGVPERTKGYFTSHTSAVSKILHGYHVQITARDSSDLEPDAIMRKVADASGAKYSGGDATPSASAGRPSGAPPPVAKKPVFTPTTSGGGSAFDPLVAARRQKQDNVDEDGWGTDAPPVTRTEIQKVESAYKPTKVNMAELASQKQEPSRFSANRQEEDRGDVVRGGYQPIGKVDIAAIRANARESQDDRPAPVKGAYEPVGKVDIAAIRAKAQKPADDTPAPAASPRPTEEPSEAPKSLAERSAAFSQASDTGRLTEMPKPKVANKFGSAAAFTGTKAPTPGGLGGAPPASAAAPMGSASRTFADQGGKTPAQLWAEKKAAQGGAAPSPAAPETPPITAQTSGGGWKSGYSGKSWAPVQTGGYGGVTSHKTGEGEEQPEQEREQETVNEQEAPASPSGGVSSLRDRFKDAPPMGSAAPAIPKAPTGEQEDNEPAPPPPPPAATRPDAPAGGFSLPGLPARPPPPAEESDDDQGPPVPARDESPVRVAMPVPRGPEPEIEPPAERRDIPPVPAQEIEKELPRDSEIDDEPERHDPARGAATAVAADQFGRDQVEQSRAGDTGAKTAIAQYDYDKTEDNEIDLRDGEKITNIDMVDEDWWMGTNTRGESGLFPSNYVELVEGGSAGGAPTTAAAVPQPPSPEPQPRSPSPPPAPAAAPAAPAAGGYTATAQFDYEAAEDNELSFPDGAKITDLQFPDDDWWFGHYKGRSGLFPANYVERDN